MLWVFRWLLRKAWVLKLLLHAEQTKGFSPVWILSWSMSLDWYGKLLSHTLQVNLSAGGRICFFLLMLGFMSSTRSNLGGGSGGSAGRESELVAI